jgi:hypothetical protein
MHLRPLILTIACGLVCTAAHATDVPVVGLKLIVVDKGMLGSAKAVFVSKDAGITKGVDTDPAAIFAELGIAYDAASGAFAMPPGAGWLVNKDTVAKYVNKTAPTGGGVKVSVLKPGKLVKVVAKNLGETPLDVSQSPSGSVYVTHSVSNGNAFVRHCTSFGTCSHKAIAGGAGYKLVCKGDSTGDPSCQGAPAPSCCEFTGAAQCAYTPTALICTAVGGTPGAAGSSCDGATGTCGGAASTGPCCGDLATPFGTVCIAGPPVEAGTCDGTFSASAVCTPSGSCS